MTDFKTDKAVDLILCLCDSINYVLSKKKVFQTFKTSILGISDHSFSKL